MFITAFGPRHWLLRVLDLQNTNPSVLVRLWYTKCQDGLDASSALVLSFLVCVENTAEFSLRVLEVSKSPVLTEVQGYSVQMQYCDKICNSWFPSGTTCGGVLRSYWGQYEAKLPNPTWKATQFTTTIPLWSGSSWGPQGLGRHEDHAHASADCTRPQLHHCGLLPSNKWFCEWHYSSMLIWHLS